MRSILHHICRLGKSPHLSLDIYGTWTQCSSASAQSPKHSTPHKRIFHVLLVLISLKRAQTRRLIFRGSAPSPVIESKALNFACDLLRFRICPAWHIPFRGFRSLDDSFRDFLAFELTSVPGTTASPSRWASDFSSFPACFNSTSNPLNTISHASPHQY
jgi:hypothetical protein